MSAAWCVGRASGSSIRYPDRRRAAASNVLCDFTHGCDEEPSRENREEVSLEEVSGRRACEVGNSGLTMTVRRDREGASMS